jgi:hypothetical protein
MLQAAVQADGSTPFIETSGTIEVRPDTKTPRDAVADRSANRADAPKTASRGHGDARTPSGSPSPGGARSFGLPQIEGFSRLSVGFKSMSIQYTLPVRLIRDSGIEPERLHLGKRGLARVGRRTNRERSPTLRSAPAFQRIVDAARLEFGVNLLCGGMRGRQRQPPRRRPDLPSATLLPRIIAASAQLAAAWAASDTSRNGPTLMQRFTLVSSPSPPSVWRCVHAALLSGMRRRAFRTQVSTSPQAPLGRLRGLRDAARP